jgi:hypothetical protein
MPLVPSRRNTDTQVDAPVLSTDLGLLLTGTAYICESAAFANSMLLSTMHSKVSRAMCIDEFSAEHMHGHRMQSKLRNHHECLKGSEKLGVNLL